MRSRPSVARPRIISRASMDAIEQPWAWQSRTPLDRLFTLSFRPTLVRLSSARARSAEKPGCDHAWRDELAHARPTRQDGHVGDVAHRLEQRHALAVRLQPQHRQRAGAGAQARQGLHDRGRLAGTVVARPARHAASG